jgi:hypothetical protein
MRLTFVLSMVLLTCSIGCRADKRVALVVGNSNYQSVASLNDPQNDATLIAETLRKVGFVLGTRQGGYL